MPLPNDIDLGQYFEAFQRDEKRMDRLERAINANSRSYRRSLFNYFDDATSRILTDADGFIIPANTNAQVLDRIFLEADRILAEAGFEDLADGLRQTYLDRLDQLNKLYDEAGLAAATVNDFQAIEAISERINKVANRLAPASDIAANEIKNAVVKARSQLVSQKIKLTELRKTLQNAGGILPRYAGTVGNTELAGIDSIGRKAQANRIGARDLRYSGVLDGLTRPYCKLQLTSPNLQIRSIHAWEAAQNNTGPNPVIIYRGGYNCRHRLLIWNRDWPNPDNDMQF